MSLLFQQKHLRLEVPETVDGYNLLLDEQGRARKKIVVLPMSALRAIQRNQAKKPQHLQAKITVVEGDTIPKAKQPVEAPVQQPEPVDTQEQFEEFDETPVVKETPVAKAKAPKAEKEKEVKS